MSDDLADRVREHAARVTTMSIDAFVPVEKRELARTQKLSNDREPVAASNIIGTTEEEAQLFNSAFALLPPYDPGILLMMYENSNALGSNVDAYKTNIESHGYHFDPVIDLDANDADKKIGDAMFLERLHAAQGEDVPQAQYPKPEEIANRRVEIEHLMRLEKAKLDSLFEECVADTSFTELRVNSRVDLEATGNAYWEALRNARGETVQFTYMPAYSVRLLPLDAETIDIRVRTRVSPISFEMTTRRARFRRFVQIIAGRVVFFKEFGDPRVMSAATGRFYPSREELRQKEPRAPEGTEVIHFRVFSPRSPYGIPRWIGNMLSVLGSRAAEEVNYLYFDNKGVPPMAIFVAGGKLAGDAKTAIEEHVQKHLKGRNNFHKILLVEVPGNAQTPGGANQVRITMEPLTGAQIQDALFQEYDQRNIDKIGSSFRNPRLLRGDMLDFNRATADAALLFAEMQVYQPERGRFDDMVNRRVLAPAGVRFWKFVSNTPITKDPEVLSTIIAKLTTTGVLVPSEARELAGPVFNRELKKITGEWLDQPLQLTLAGILPADGATAEDIAGAIGTATTPADAGAPAAPAKPLTPDERRLQSVAANLSALRDRLRSAEQGAASKDAQQQRRAFDDEQVIEIPVTRDQLSSWIVPE